MCPGARMALNLGWSSESASREVRVAVINDPIAGASESQHQRTPLLQEAAK